MIAPTLPAPDKLAPLITKLETAEEGFDQLSKQQGV